MKKIVVTILAIALVVGSIIYAFNYRNRIAFESIDTNNVEKFVSKNISELSSIKESLGGKFYVTKIEAHGGVGTVEYEDGHNAYVADFKYSIDKKRLVSIDSFIVRNE